MVESKEELKSLLMKEKEESEKVGLKLNILPWLIHVNVWQKLLQYCKVINLQLIKISGKKKKKNSTFRKLRSWHQFPSLPGK